jgi:two-component system, sensor histidine kinase and response regulator
LLVLNAVKLYASSVDSERFLKEIQKTHSVKEYGIKWVQKDGTQIDVVMTLTAWRDKDGNIIGYQGIIRDITERKRAEEIQQHLVAIVESSHDAIIGKTLDGIITSWNKGAQERYGYSAAEVVGRPISILIPSERAYEMPQFLAKVGRGEAVIDCETERITKDGRRVTVLLTISPIKDISGKIVGASTIAQDITERKRVHEVLMESEEKIRGIFDAIGDSVTVVDKNGKIIELNESAVRMFGIKSKEEAIGMDGLAFVAADDSPMVTRQMGEVLSVGKAAPLTQFKYKRLDGTTFYGETSSVILHGAQGNVVGLIGVIRDVTERRHLEEALREGEEKLRLIFEAIADGIIVIDLKGNVVDVNEATVRIGGYENRSQLIGTDAFDLIAHKDRKMVMDDLKDRMDGHPKERMEYSIYLKDGGAFEAELTASTLRDENGNPIGYIAVVRDISERKRLEALLKESEKKFRELADFLPQTIFEIDLEGHLTYANRYGFESTGYTMENLEKGLNAIELFVPEQRDRIAKNILAVLAGEKFDDHEYRVLRKDGSVYPVLIYTNAVVRDGRPVGIRGIVLDITERKKIEQMKTDFVSFISHQLRTPVAGLMAYIDNMLDGVTGTLNDMQVDYLREMHGVCERNSRLISDLLSISRIERGVLAVNINPVDLRSVVNIAVKEHRQSIEEKGLTLNIRGMDRETMVLADNDKLIEVLKNVIHNATKFTSAGSISIEIVAEGQNGIVKVSDTGPGLSKAALQDLFKKERVFGGAVAVGGGSGLGLYIAKGFMQLQHGDITAESVEGQGSTFVISLPIK